MGPGIYAAMNWPEALFFSVCVLAGIAGMVLTNRNG